MNAKSGKLLLLYVCPYSTERYVASYVTTVCFYDKLCYPFYVEIKCILRKDRKILQLALGKM